MVGHKLKDLFVSSPSFEEEEEEEEKGKGKSGTFTVAAKLNGVASFGVRNGLSVETGSPRPSWVGFRYRLLLRRAWRPMLVAIPE